MANWIVRSKRVDGVREPGILKCECGAQVTIDYDGVECDACGQPYNLFGQRLRRDHDLVTSYGEAADYMNEGD